MAEANAIVISDTTKYKNKIMKSLQIKFILFLISPISYHK